MDRLEPSKTVLQFFKDTYPNDMTAGFTLFHPHPPTHSVDQLDPSKTVLQFFKDTYPNDIATGFKKDEDDWRAFVGE